MTTPSTSQTRSVLTPETEADLTRIIGPELTELLTKQPPDEASIVVAGIKLARINNWGPIANILRQTYTAPDMVRIQFNLATAIRHVHDLFVEARPLVKLAEAVLSRQPTTETES